MTNANKTSRKMPSKTADEILTMLQIKRMRRGSLNAVQQAVYERITHAEIAREAAEMFGA